MKVKNVKVGVRVQYKGEDISVIPYGAVGTVVRDNDTISCWDVSWDNRDDLYNRGGEWEFDIPEDSIYGVHIKDLRKVK